MQRGLEAREPLGWNPPGGGGQCPPTHMSICRSDGYQCQHECVAPPQYVSQSQDLLDEWAYQVVTHSSSSGPLSPQQRFTVTAGRYVDPITGEVTTFSVPVGGANEETQELTR